MYQQPLPKQQVCGSMAVVASNQGTIEQAISNLYYCAHINRDDDAQTIYRAALMRTVNEWERKVKRKE